MHRDGACKDREHCLEFDQPETVSSRPDEERSVHGSYRGYALLPTVFQLGPRTHVSAVEVPKSRSHDSLLGTAEPHTVIAPLAEACHRASDVT